jgi:predicted enzyme related to lactoylglutathione lyase
MTRVVHFEIQASDPVPLVRFYAELFDWAFRKWEGPMDYWLIETGPGSQVGINGGLLPRRGPRPIEGQAVNAFVCTVGVDELDATLARALELGAEVAVPKMAVQGVGWLAYFKDPDGNIVGIMEGDPTAA